MTNKVSGIVFNIQQFSVHDGPGIRTIVFLKGCPLRCQWCANPESQYQNPELTFNYNKCIGIKECALCIKACPKAAISELADSNSIKIDRAICNNCDFCAESCPSKALELFGKTMTVDAVLKIVEEDSVFYARSGGGITLSGGEPLMQADFAYELLKEAKGRGMNTAIETCGYANWDKTKKVFEYANTVFYDIKCLDSERHKVFTNVSNEVILANFERLCNEFPSTQVVVRTPVIPGFNDWDDDIKAIRDYVKIYPNVEYELLAYHRFGESKYSYLGREYLLKDVEPLSQEQIKKLRLIVG
ncbi:(2S)-3-sulfopropanediol dehydratase activating enzyme [Desulforamulus aquiferis]|uniref:Glycyl-radical enzyme activating protein n=1 Tax=Desulforamulus aquiferis TaxID=1397668 RepID=A0AAW7Z619_9FIRM|nr:glycyl-radical enzyme activating protein [Desulforamulus aquiferis]MDO7785704.1 glycyl-radical enzyme activating protein [Desulforamulus aquiferis]